MPRFLYNAPFDEPENYMAFILQLRDKEHWVWTIPGHPPLIPYCLFVTAVEDQSASCAT